MRQPTFPVGRSYPMISSAGFPKASQKGESPAPYVEAPQSRIAKNLYGRGLMPFATTPSAPTSIGSLPIICVKRLVMETLPRISENSSLYLSTVCLANAMSNMFGSIVRSVWLCWPYLGTIRGEHWLTSTSSKERLSSPPAQTDPA